MGDEFEVPDVRVGADSVLKVYVNLLVTMYSGHGFSTWMNGSSNSMVPVGIGRSPRSEGSRLRAVSDAAAGPEVNSWRRRRKP